MHFFNFSENCHLYDHSCFLQIYIFSIYSCDFYLRKTLGTPRFQIYSLILYFWLWIEIFKKNSDWVKIFKPGLTILILNIQRSTEFPLNRRIYLPVSDFQKRPGFWIEGKKEINLQLFDAIFVYTRDTLSLTCCLGNSLPCHSVPNIEPN